jgi:hypothetical protein
MFNVLRKEIKKEKNYSEGNLTVLENNIKLAI